jgi:hypothetical protein
MIVIASVLFRDPKCTKTGYGTYHEILECKFAPNILVSAATKNTLGVADKKPQKKKYQSHF